jgi:hypothetical protein
MTCKAEDRCIASGRPRVLDGWSGNQSSTI